MITLIVTFDGPRIVLQGIENTTRCQLFVASHWLKRNAPDLVDNMDGSHIVVITLDDFQLTVTASSDMTRGHFMALAGELLFRALSDG